jgi:hypothetical protein
MSNVYQSSISCHPKNAATVANSIALMCIKIGLESYSVTERPRSWWQTRRRFIVKAEDADGDKVGAFIKGIEALCAVKM